MRGSIVKRGERYHAVVDLPPAADGRRRQKWLSGNGSKREAEAALSAVYGQLLADGRHDGHGGLSARSVRYLHTVLRKAFADAVR